MLTLPASRQPRRRALSKMRSRAWCVCASMPVQGMCSSSSTGMQLNRAFVPGFRMTKNISRLWRKGVDLYCELISSLLGRTVTKATDPQARDVGKNADIGNGYQMGDKAFDRLCSANGIDLAAQGLTAAMVVKAYRQRYYKIADPETGLWTRLERGALQAVRGIPTCIGRVRFEMTPAGQLDLVLPNASRRRYWHPTVERRSPPWTAAGDLSLDRDVLVVARNIDDKPSEVLYGGRWLENICQSVGREILAGFLVAAEKVTPDAACVGHVHDEAIFEVPEEQAAEILQVLIRLAEQDPPWAAGLPLKVEAHIAPFWSKQPLPWWDLDASRLEASEKLSEV